MINRPSAPIKDYADSEEHRAQLAAGTAAAGHSYGGLLAGRLTATRAASACISLSGEWVEAVGVGINVLGSIRVPALFAWGTGNDADAAFEGRAGAALWDQVRQPKHRLRFLAGSHFDYLKTGQSACANNDRGPCGLVGAVAADVAALFLSRYMPPPDVGFRAGSVRVTLTPPALKLTPEQQSFAGGHLGGLHALPRHSECRVRLDDEVTGPTGRLKFDPSSINFGSVPLNTTQTLSFSVENATGATVNISIQAPSANAPFSWKPFDGTLAVGARRHFNVQFRPTSRAVERATLVVTSTAPGSPYSIVVIGKTLGGF